MYPQQYPSAPPPPPAYNTATQVNQYDQRESLRNYHTTSDERMVGFQQLVDRYESKFVIENFDDEESPGNI